MTLDATALIAPVVSAVIVAIGCAFTLSNNNAKTEAKMEERFKAINYRIDLLAKQVEKHNSIVERTFKLESDMLTQWRRHDELKERVERLEDMKIGGSD